MKKGQFGIPIVQRLSTFEVSFPRWKPSEETLQKIEEIERNARTALHRSQSVILTNTRPAFAGLESICELYVFSNCNTVYLAYE